MADGFTVQETLDHAPAEVWAYLTDFDNAPQWMTGIGTFTRMTQGPLEIGTRFGFKARGKERETRVTALDPGRLIALTSTQGGVTATYTYALTPAGDGTEITLTAVCKATGLWILVHPVIVLAMNEERFNPACELETGHGAAGGPPSSVPGEVRSPRPP
jgi:uncharacterized protein YndB with AHSA1/START domain